jgi:nicotinamidase-related amidase
MVAGISLRDREVAGSNPVAPTFYKLRQVANFHFFAGAFNRANAPTLGSSAEKLSPLRSAGQIDERVRPLPGETVLAKEHASAFAGTPLVGRLLGHHVDTLLITGCSTSACVRATATDAKSHGLKPVVPSAVNRRHV